MRMICKGALVLAVTLGCGLVAWLGVALAMEIADTKAILESEARHYADEVSLSLSSGLGRKRPGPF